MQLESMPCFTEQVQHLGNLKTCIQHYRLPESSVRTMRDKYRRIVNSSPTTKAITFLNRVTPLILGSLSKNVKKLY